MPALPLHHARHPMAWAAAGIGLLAYLLIPALHRLAYDTAYLAKRPEAPAEVLLVTLDAASHRELNQRPEDRWSRSLHAQLIDRLTPLQPAAIVFDVVFPDAGVQGDAADATLIAAAARSGRVIVAADLQPVVRTGATGTELRPPFADLRTVTRWGTTRMLGDGAVRQSFAEIAGVPSLARTVHAWLVESGIHTTQGATDRDFWMRYYGPAGTLPRLPYHEVLRGTLNREQVEGRVIIVGADYAGPYPAAGALPQGTGTDLVPTPYTRFTGARMPGLEVVATDVLNRVRGDGLRRLPPWAEAITVLLLGLGLTYLLRPASPSQRPVLLRASVAFALLAGLGLSTIDLASGWFPWTVPAFVQLPIAFWSARILVRAHSGKPSALHTASRGTPSAMSSTGPDPRGRAAADLPHIPDLKLLREIGRGAYGTVWLARDALGHQRAVKVVHRTSFAEGSPYEREFEGLRRYAPVSLRHPGFTPILHVGRNDAAGHFHYVMEAADDVTGVRDATPEIYRPRTLSADLARRGALPADEVLHLGVVLARTLSFLHGTALVHRDIKPDNILFIHSAPCLGDPGLVAPRSVAPGEVSMVGTPDYLPTEGPGTVAAEVFALGKTLYAALTGKPAASFPELPTNFAERPDAALFKRLNQILLTACDPDPSLRHPTMEALALALESVRPLGNNRP